MSDADRLLNAETMLAHHWPITQQIARYLSAALMAAGPRLPHRAYQTLSKSLAIAEAMMRRMLILIALSFNPPKLRAAPARAAKTPNSATTAPATATRRPYFALSEPGPPPEPSAPRPRIRVIDYEQMALDRLNGKTPEPHMPPAAPVRYTADDLRDPVPLMARVAGLIDAIEHTGHHAARMARWIYTRDRQDREGKAPPRRLVPLKMGPPPGASKKRMGETVWQAYVALHLAALREMRRALFDTS